MNKLIKNREVNLIAGINTLSYGYTSTNILRELSKDTRVNLFPIGPLDVDNQEAADLVVACKKNADSFNPTAPSLRIWHHFDLAEHVGRGVHIGFPIFELDTFTPREIHHLSYCDEIFVPSQWAKEVVQNNLDQPSNYSDRHTHVIPLGVDTSIFKLADADVVGRPFRFLNVGKWEHRKGHNILGMAFAEAFQQGENVELWMACHNSFIDNTPWENMYKEALGDRVFILGRAKSQLDIANLMQQCDVGVFPSRAEGWNLPLLEMMACGKACIATDYSAHTEFCSSNSCMMIDIDEVESAQDGVWFHGQGSWAKFEQKQFDQLVHWMKFSYANKRECQALGEIALNVAKQFSWTNTVEQIYATGLLKQTEVLPIKEVANAI